MAVTSRAGGADPSPQSVLSAEATLVPKWLMDYRVGEPFPLNKFLQSRVVYYPGAGEDRHPFYVFGETHAAHCFAFADYETSQGDARRLLHFLDSPQKHSYVQIAHGELSREELTLKSLYTVISQQKGDPQVPHDEPSGGQYAVWSILEGGPSSPKSQHLRIPRLPQQPRFALLYVGYEAIAAYHALFCLKGSKPPYAILLQDHGLGGGWTEFGGKGSLLLRTARQSGLPRWLLVARNTTAWPGYELVSGPDRGGLHNTPRSLYRLKKAR